ncbi:hypothetical protein KPL78_29455 [Roseomonas sp. HJA6]|uniref:Uncharacterized protein n=1 Tax=Roseomonas alba TaxID=2846776 RepID=A0ABS7AI62_9PROT|nr:hypothetical protein [Neoroseomonas alba]MBW6402009.1 hypothetical protein [Neoroseomonas alba]
MILGILFLLGGAFFVLLAWRRLRGARDPNWVRADGTRLVVEPAPGQDTPRVTLWRGDGVAFGPCGASWDPPKDMRSLPPPLPGSGIFRVACAADLDAEDAFGTGDGRLARTLRDALGTRALLLMPVDGDRPVLLHGRKRGARTSAGGIGIEQAQLDALVALLGDPAGLRVEVRRRRVQRSGWGGAQGQRQRGRQ